MSLKQVKKFQIIETGEILFTQEFTTRKIIETNLYFYSIDAPWKGNLWCQNGVHYFYDYGEPPVLISIYCIDTWST